MRKASRLFEIIQILKLSRRAVTAAEIAARLEVTVRSIYRDIAALQAMRVPIEGERGLGYILRPGFDLPPLMFDHAEADAILLGLRLLERTGDMALKDAAGRVGDKIAAAVPEPLRKSLMSAPLYAWGGVATAPPGVDMGLIRQAIRDETVLSLRYGDEQGRVSARDIRPIALIYYSDWMTLVAWCDLRQAIRNFRTDRILAVMPSGQRFQGDGERLRQLWVAGWTNQPTSPLGIVKA
ncbi:helix-turn-helix transcriptional regulator [Rhizobium halophytocola]|uniref:DNA-binding transcriptional regulator YafY n=1 Tax=Rhizobium halophytocola TaxID=735519 RepID=A0ABS4DWW9_9HYPH|nr:YafY family protein [Rhizobium halophytocola]MBP1850177.1 putative DNA-binding transcriptional regulator YafY [Rhizobium halophytocola]